MAYPPLPLGPRDDNSPATPNQHAQDHTDERAAIDDIVGVLGPAPQGSKGTVQARLSDVEDAAAGASSSAGSAAAAAAAAQSTADGAAQDASAAQDAAADAHARLNNLDAADVSYTGAEAVSEPISVSFPPLPSAVTTPGFEFRFDLHPLSFTVTVDGGAPQQVLVDSAVGPFALAGVLNGQVEGATFGASYTPPRVNLYAEASSVVIADLVDGDGVDNATNITEGAWSAGETVEAALDRALSGGGPVVATLFDGGITHSAEAHLRNGPNHPVVPTWAQFVTLEVSPAGGEVEGSPAFQTPLVIEEDVNDKLEVRMWAGPIGEGVPERAEVGTVAAGTYTTIGQLAIALREAAVAAAGSSSIDVAVSDSGDALRVFHRVPFGNFEFVAVPGNTGLATLGFTEGVAWLVEDSLEGVTGAPFLVEPGSPSGDPLELVVEHSVWDPDLGDFGGWATAETARFEVPEWFPDGGTAQSLNYSFIDPSLVGSVVRVECNPSDIWNRTVRAYFR